MILQGELVPQMRINEVALAEKLGVSRGPVREACRALQAMGLVISQPNRGFFVRLLSRTEAIDAYHTRAALIAYAGSVLAQKITPSQLGQLEKLIVAMDDVAIKSATGDTLSEYDPLNLDFHESILEMTGNKRLKEAYNDLVREQHLFRRRGLSLEGSLLTSNAEHRSIFEALKEKDAAGASDTMRDHVLNGMQRMLDVTE